MGSFNFNEMLTATMVLFAVIDIVGSIPLIIKLKQQAGHIQSEKTALVSLVLMITFLFVGTKILELIGIDVNSFAVAGALVIFIVALEMVLGIHIFSSDSITPKTASIVPLAFPLIAGAGTMTSIISLKAEFQTINIVFAIVINCFIVFVVLKLTRKIEGLLGQTGIMVIEKVFGIILLAIAVKLFSSNASQLFIPVPK